MKPVRIVSIAVLLAGIAGCSPREEPALSYAQPVSPAPAATTRVPAERSYLDVGPAPNRGGPAYIRDNITSAPRQTDSFGNDLLPRTP